MYPKNAASPPPIGIGCVVQISDGAVQTTGVSARIKVGSGAWAAAANTPTCDATSGIWEYTPSQAETNTSGFVVALYKASCVPIEKTVITVDNSVAGTPPDSSGTGTLLTRLSSARAGYLDNLSAGAVALQSTASAILDDTGTTGVLLATGALSAAAIASAGADKIADATLDRADAIETGITLRQAIRYSAAALAGTLSGGGTATIVIKNINGSTTRITATVDANGNRSVVTLS